MRTISGFLRILIKNAFENNIFIVLFLLLITFLIIGCFGFPPCDSEQNDPESGIPPTMPTEPDEVHSTNKSERHYTTTNSNGSKITLTIPSFSMLDAGTIDLIPLEDVPSSPFEKVVCPGVDIRSSGLGTLDNAYLDIRIENTSSDFSEPPVLWFFKMVDSDYAIPVITEVLDDGITLRAHLHSFSTIFLAAPTSQEIEVIINGRLHIVPIDFIDLVDNTAILGSFAKMLNLLDNPSTAGVVYEGLFKKIINEQDILLTIPQMSDKCDAYLPKLLEFRHSLSSVLQPLAKLYEDMMENPESYSEEAFNAQLDETFCFVGARELLDEVFKVSEKLDEMIDLVADECPARSIWDVGGKIAIENPDAMLIPVCAVSVELSLSGTCWMRLDRVIKGKLKGTFSVYDHGQERSDSTDFCEKYESGHIAMQTSLDGIMVDSTLVIWTRSPFPEYYEYTRICWDDNPPEIYEQERGVSFVQNLTTRLPDIYAPYNGRYTKDFHSSNYERACPKTIMQDWLFELKQ